MSQAVPALDHSRVFPRGHDAGFAAATVIVAVLSIAFFAWLAAQVVDGHTLGFDLYVRGQVHRGLPAWLLPIMLGLSIVGSAADLAVLSGILVFWFWRLQWRDAAAALAASMSGAAVLDLSLKHVFHRTRPVAFFGSEPQSYSFPSGHALASFCFFVALAAVLAPRIRRSLLRVIMWIAAACLVAAVGLSRVWLGVHYPTDVVGGYVAAALWVSVIWACGITRVATPNPPPPRP